MQQSLFEYLRKVYIYEIIFLSLIPAILTISIAYFKIGDPIILLLLPGFLPFFYELYILYTNKNPQSLDVIAKARRIHVIVSFTSIFACTFFIPAIHYDYLLFIPLGISILSFQPFFGNKERTWIFAGVILCTFLAAGKEIFIDIPDPRFVVVIPEFLIYLIWVSAGLTYISFRVNEKHRMILDLHQEKIHKNMSDLRKANTELEAFSYRAAHDFRGPLVSLHGIMSLIEKDIDQTEMKELAGMGLKSIERLDELIKNLISLSQNSSLPEVKKPIDLYKAITKKVESYQWEIDNKNIDIEINLPFNTFMSDPIRLEFVLDNIINNAIKYSDPSKTEKYLKISSDVVDEKIQIHFEDNGIGIKEQQLPKVYKMFHRADSSSKGSGLGLYIVKEALDKIGGEIAVDSSYGVGSIFTLTIPINEASFSLAS